MSSIKNNIETTIKTLENFYVNQHDLEDVAIALYHVASEYARMFALQSNICNDIDDIIATAVEDILNDLSKLVANSDSAHAFRKWCCYRLKTIIRNKAKDHYRQETAHLRKCVSGDNSIHPRKRKHHSVFDALKGPMTSTLRTKRRRCIANVNCFSSVERRRLWLTNVLLIR